MTTIKRNDFCPVTSLDNKRNYKRFFRIEQDGLIVERIFLNVSDPAHREHLIFLHYMKHLVKLFINRNLGFNILERNNPWDFKIRLSTGEIINIEITSIADSTKLFEIQKREDFYAKCCQQPQIRLRDLQKILTLFPNLQLNNEIVSGLPKKGASKDEKVDNPLYGKETNIFISTMAENHDPLEIQIRSAIEAKISKNHAEKENTVLIIDNRTSAYNMKEYYSACESLSGYLKKIPFLEVWFYTGYFSDDDGNNSEYSFGPLKIQEQQKIILEKFIGENTIDESGRLVC